MIVVVYAHPYPDRSRAGRALLEAVQGLPGVEVRSLYELYPDFGIDVEAEQDALTRADTIVWQHPLYWYSVPGLLKHWFDKVLAHGCMHQHPFASFVAPVEQTARFCGMQWLEPIQIHGAHRVSTHTMRELAASYRQRLIELSRSEEATVATA
jgi:glutathione-regulated potassium-efflux system ancillary protein KefF